MRDATVSDRSFRLAMRQLPSSVVVVTAADGSGARGITVGSFTSLSLQPRLVTFNVARRSRMHPVITAASRFAANVVGRARVDVVQRFAMPGLTAREQFDSIPFEPDEFGAPVLREAVAVITGEVREVIPAGDHSIVVGEVTGVERRTGAAPILYYDRAYREVGPRVAP